MKTEIRDRIFLCLAIALAIFLNACYLSGLYYDQDVAYYAYNTLKFFKISAILLGKGFFHSPFSHVVESLTQASGDSLSAVLPPGINVIFLGAFLLFGKSFISIQIFSLIANTCSVILLYILAKYILSKAINLYFLLPVFYALFSVSEAIKGHSSNTETFISTFEIAGILFLGLAVNRKKIVFYFLSGFILGLGFLVKQSVFAVFLTGLTFIFSIKLIYKEPLRVFLKNISLFVVSFSAPVLLISAYLLYSGMWHVFIRNPFLSALRHIKNTSFIRSFYLLWGLQKVWQMLKFEIIIFGLLALAGIVYASRRYKKPERLLCLLWFVIPVSVISMMGFHLRQHFIEILAPLLALSIMGVSDIYNLAMAIGAKNRIVSRIFVGLGILILAFPFFHLITPLIKANKPASSFFLTQRYLNSDDKDKYAKLLIRESPDAARRFLISQYLRQHTAKDDVIFVWDNLGGCSIYLWAQRYKKLFFPTKATFLPEELRDPSTRAIWSGKKINYKLNQKNLLRGLKNNPPVYIVVVKTALPMPNAPFSASEMINLEKAAFGGFYDFLDNDYRLEKEITGCLAYRRIK